ncbi:MAG: MBL fold metallo-hydrolase [Victivallaceae bacterium]|nr:MBL fold metallo-hydrolase [Victivallaceae bacterium]
MLRITTLGTSHGRLTPRRSHTATLVQTGNRNYLIDAGTPSFYTLSQMGFFQEKKMLDAVLITHCHLDHTNDLPLILAKVAHARTDETLPPFEVILPEARDIPPLKMWCDINQEHEKYFHHVHFGVMPQRFEDGTIELTAIANKHLAHEPAASFSFLLKAEGKKIFFSGDVCGDLSDFPGEKMDDCDAVFYEMTHYPFEQSMELFRRRKIKRLIFQHIWEEWDTPEGRAKFARLTANLPFPAEMAEDGTEYCF